MYKGPSKNYVRTSYTATRRRARDARLPHPCMRAYVLQRGAVGLTQGFVISFHVNSTGRWAILLLLSSQASNKMLGKLLKANEQNLYVRPSAPLCTSCT